jgi:hypothetical protein
MSKSGLPTVPEMLFENGCSSMTLGGSKLKTQGPAKWQAALLTVTGSNFPGVLFAFLLYCISWLWGLHKDCPLFCPTFCWFGSAGI